MYKVCYYSTTSESTVLFKWFKTLQEAISFANNKPNNSVLEIKHYDDVDNRKPDRN
jgi:hypothetical protein